MKVKDNNPLRNKINLFIKTVNDLQNYRIDPEEKENIFSIPENMKNVLREIISSQEISEFIIDISNEKLEKTKKNDKKSKNKITKEVKEKEEEPINLFKYKKFQNIHINKKFLRIYLNPLIIVSSILCGGLSYVEL